MPFQLKKLPYEFDALEPHIDAETMKVHYTKHYQTYCDKLNEALSSLGANPTDSIEQVLLEHGDNTAVRNNGGGFYNHSLFWDFLSPNGGGQPKGELAGEIDKHFGSFDGFQKELTSAGLGRFGSGWAWLAASKEDDALVVFSQPNQDAPDTQQYVPLLGFDVWEHAYYLKYQNRRPEYLAALWNLVNWSYVEERYAQRKASST